METLTEAVCIMVASEELHMEDTVAMEVAWDTAAMEVHMGEAMAV